MEDFEKLINGDKPTLVDFYATWCGPCKMQSPILEQVKEKVGDTANVIKIDVDRNEALSQRYRIQSVPTLIVFRNGEPQWRGSGLHQADDLIEHIKRS